MPGVIQRFGLTHDCVFRTSTDTETSSSLTPKKMAHFLKNPLSKSLFSWELPRSLTAGKKKLKVFAEVWSLCTGFLTLPPGCTSGIRCDALCFLLLDPTFRQPMQHQMCLDVRCHRSTGLFRTLFFFLCWISQRCHPLLCAHAGLPTFLAKHSCASERRQFPCGEKRRGRH